MTELQYSIHISCTEGWQPKWRHSSADFLYLLHLLCSNWLIILVASLVATPTSVGQNMMRQSIYKRQTSEDPEQVRISLLHKVNMQYVHCRLIASYCLLLGEIL